MRLSPISRSLLLCLGLGLGCPVHPTSAQAPAATPAALRVHSLSLTAEAVDASEIPLASSTPATMGQPARPTILPPKVRVSRDTDSVKIIVRNFGPVPDTAHVEWYFVAVGVGVDATGQDYILAQSTRDLPLAAGATESFVIESPVVEVTEKLSGGRNKKPLAEREKGSTLRGWFARIVADGRVVAARGSSQTYEDTAKDEARLAALKAVPPPRTSRRRKTT